MGVVQVIDALGLDSAGRIGLGGGLRDAVEQQVAQLVGREVQGRVAREQRDLRGQLVGGVEIADDAVLGRLVLALVQLGAGECRLAVDVERRIQRRIGVRAKGQTWRCAGQVRNLKPFVGLAEDRRDAAVVIEQIFQIGEALVLLGIVMDRIGPTVRRLDPQAVLQIAARHIVVEVPGCAPVLKTRLDLAMAAAIDRHVAAVLRRAALGGDVDDAGGAQAVLGGQGAGDQFDIVGQPWIERLAEHAEALRQDDAVQAKLKAVVFTADVQLAKGILSHARRLEDDLVQGRVVADRHRLDGLGADRIGRGAGLRLDRRARRVQALGRDDHFTHRGSRSRCRVRVRVCPARGHAQRQQARGYQKPAL